MKFIFQLLVKKLPCVPLHIKHGNTNNVIFLFWPAKHTMRWTGKRKKLNHYGGNDNIHQSSLCTRVCFNKALQYFISLHDVFSIIYMHYLDVLWVSQMLIWYDLMSFKNVWVSSKSWKNPRSLTEFRTAEQSSDYSFICLLFITTMHLKYFW